MPAAIKNYQLLTVTFFNQRLFTTLCMLKVVSNSHGIARNSLKLREEAGFYARRKADVLFWNTNCCVITSSLCMTTTKKTCMSRKELCLISCLAECSLCQFEPIVEIDRRRTLRKKIIMNYVVGVLCALLAGLCTVTAGIVDVEGLFSKASNNFAIKFYSVLAAGSSSENFVFSPFSIQTSAAMLYTGAAGSTAEEMAKSLQLLSNDRVAVAHYFQMALAAHKAEQLEIANKIYVAIGQEVEPEFHRIVADKFNSAEETIDFRDKEKATTTINNWVKNVTHDKIAEIVSSNTFSNNTLLMLLNAIHFKGAWEMPFPPAFKGDFWTINGKVKEIELMSALEDFKVGSFPELGAQVLEMDYYLSNISMMVLLPYAKDGLAALEEKLASIDLFKISTQLGVNDYVDVILPKFKIEYSLDLQEPFEKMGMGRIFSDDADFSNMIHSPTIKVGKALHKTFIDVNEHGTEAAGVTVYDLRPKALYPSFYARHPFIFAIKSKTAVLFLGRFLG